MNALWLNNIPTNIRILLLNNGCGGIFTTIGAPNLDCVNAPHHTTAEAWAKAQGFRYQSVMNEQDWQEALPSLTQCNEGPVFVEAFTNAQQDAAILKNFYTEH